MGAVVLEDEEEKATKCWGRRELYVENGICCEKVHLAL